MSFVEVSRAEQDGPPNPEPFFRFGRGDLHSVLKVLFAIVFRDVTKVDHRVGDVPAALAIACD